MQNQGKYLYCIIEASEPESFGPLGIGGRGDEVHTICYHDLSAVVSDSPIIEYAVSRENTLAHERVIEEVMKNHTVLPVRFCTIAKDEAKIRIILEKEYDRFKEMMNWIDGKKELGLKAMFVENVVYGNILKKHEEIRVFKEKIASLPPEKSLYQRMEIGRMVEIALQKEKDIHKEYILDTLSPLAVDVKINNTYGELMVINAAFLVEKLTEAQFDQKVQELGNKYDGEIKFKYIGTVPPFNFVNLVIETGEY